MTVYVEYECRPPERPLFVTDTLEEMAQHQNRHIYSLKNEIRQTKYSKYNKNYGTKVVKVEI